jgi:signal transduction histidine kinase/HAMP domain-containing protein
MLDMGEEIHPELSRRVVHKPVGTLNERAAKCDHFRTDLKATNTNVGSRKEIDALDCGCQSAQLLEQVSENASESRAPSAVYPCDGERAVRTLKTEQKGHAVGGLNDERQIGFRGPVAIALWHRRFVAPVTTDHCRSMHLFELSATVREGLLGGRMMPVGEVHGDLQLGVMMVAMGLRQKLLLCFLVVIAPLTFVFGYGVHQLSAIDGRLVRVTAHLMPSLRLLKKFEQEIQVATQLLDLKFYQNLETFGFPQPWQDALTGIEKHLTEIAPYHPTAQTMISRVAHLRELIDKRETRKLLDELPLVLRWFEREIDMETLLCQRDFRETSNRLALVLLSTLILSVVVFVFVHMHLRRFSVLVAAIQNVAKGKFQLLWPVERVRRKHSADEVDVLAREFNSMVLQLEKREEKLTEQHRLLQTALEQNQSRETVLHGLVAFLDRTLHHLPISVHVFDVQGHIVFENESAKPLHAGNFEEFCHYFDGTPELVNRLEDAFAGSAASLGTQKMAAETRYWDVTVAPLKFLEQGSAVLLVMSEDVTEKIISRNKLIQSERLVAIGQMSAQVAHEIRNPLNAMSLNLEILNEEVSDKPQTNHHIRILLEEIARLDRITQNYLEASSLKSPNQENWQALETIVGDTVALFQETAQQQNIRISYHLSAHARKIKRPSDSVRSVLINLVRNAMNAVRRDGAIDVSVRVHENHVMLSVEDSGPGIDPGLRQAVLEPFFSTSTQGTGLGLTIVQSELEKMKGNLAIKEGVSLSGARMECDLGSVNEAAT